MKTGRSVRSTCVDTACGCIGHMTVDEIKDRTVGESLNVSCPVCGKIHLTEEDREKAEKEKIVGTKRYRLLQDSAEKELI